jgi:hypothetical protein
MSGLRTEQPRNRVRFLAQTGDFAFSNMSIPALESDQPPIQPVPGTLSPEVKRPRREVCHSASSAIQLFHFPPYTFIRVVSTGRTLLYLAVTVLYCSRLNNADISCNLLDLVNDIRVTLSV